MRPAAPIVLSAALLLLPTALGPGPARAADPDWEARKPSWCCRTEASISAGTAGVYAGAAMVHARDFELAPAAGAELPEPFASVRSDAAIALVRGFELAGPHSCGSSGEGGAGGAGSTVGAGGAGSTPGVSSSDDEGCDCSVPGRRRGGGIAGFALACLWLIRRAVTRPRGRRTPRRRRGSSPRVLQGCAPHTASSSEMVT
jgi:hypothetical protein